MDLYDMIELKKQLERGRECTIGLQDEEIDLLKSLLQVKMDEAIDEILLEERRREEEKKASY